MKPLIAESNIDVKVEQDGNIVEQFSGSNKVVNTGLEYIVACLNHEDYPPISGVVFGDNGEPTDDDDVDVRGTITRTEPVQVSREANKLTLSVSFQNETDSPIMLAEFCLVVNAGDDRILVARYARPDWALQPTQNVDITWGIAVRRQ